MRFVPPPSTPPAQNHLIGGGSGAGGGGYRDKDAESLFRTKPIAEIRNVEASTRRHIQDKSQELRQLVGNRYRDLIDSADSIVEMKASCEAISANIAAIHHGILNSLSSASEITPKLSPNLARARIYGIACRIKYLVDTPENIWGCLDESMFMEAAARYVRAKHVHQGLGDLGTNGIDIDDSKKKSLLSNFPLLQHQWQIVESFKAQISQRSRERLLDHALDLGIAAYADALAAVAIIDELDPKQVLSLFLDSRKSCISQKLAGSSVVNVTGSEVISVFCEVLKIIQVSVGQVGELFLQVLNDMPLFYKTILSSPPASQLFGGIPNPEEEVRLWTLFREKLESVMVMLDRNFISRTCSDWLSKCGKGTVSKISGRYLIDAILNGHELAAAEKLLRETMDSKEALEGSLEWLKSVFGSEVDLPWNRIRELVLGDDADLWDEIFEDAFVERMKTIIELGFDELSVAVKVAESVHAIEETPVERVDFEGYVTKALKGGGVWFMETNGKKVGPVSHSKTQPEENDFCSFLNAYFGPEVSRIRDAVDSCCENVLEDLLSFLESPKASLRLKDLAPYLQNKCHRSISTILLELNNELENLCANLENGKSKVESTTPPSIIVERALFIGRLLFSFQKHSRHVPVILGSPRLWMNKTSDGVSGKSPSLVNYTRLATGSAISDASGRKVLDSSKRQTSLVTAALFGADDSSSPQLEELSRTMQDLCIRAHNLWISWVSAELSAILSRNLRQDDALSATTPLRQGWEETVVKQEQSVDGQSEMKISLPSMPSLYMTSFLFQACEETHRVGGHVLDKLILQNFAAGLLEKVNGVYEDFLSTEEAHGSLVSEKGVLQVLLDLRFAADILSVGDSSAKELSKVPKVKIPRRKQDTHQTKSVIQERLDGLADRLSSKLDPIDWLTFEPYLWENERQSYLRHAVLFGFFVQLNRMYTDTVQKLPTNSESNIMRCSTVPRFKYLPISAPALSSRGATKTSIAASLDDISSRSSWKSYTHDDLSRKIDVDDNSSLGVAAPFLKSFMQVGSRFGESTLKLGSILTDGQVGRFGDILPVQAAGLLSSFTAGRSDS